MKTITKSLFAIALFINGVITYAQVVEPVDKNKVANGGYDLVAYFTDNAAVKGNKKFTLELNGVKYQFASEAHKSLFKSNPEKYLPECDGYCAWGVAEKGKKVPVNPETFKIIPIVARSIISAVPPWLIKTSGTPVNGNSPTNDAILRNDCAVSIVTSPVTI